MVSFQTLASFAATLEPEFELAGKESNSREATPKVDSYKFYWLEKFPIHDWSL